MPASVEFLSEGVLLLRFGDSIDVDINAKVHAAVYCLARCDLPGIEEYIPAYTTLAVAFEPSTWFDAIDPRGPGERLAEVLLDCLRNDDSIPRETGRRVEIPVCYDQSLAPDLLDTAARLDIDPAELASRHAAGAYRVAMLGFAPGFPYLLGLEPALQVPRRAQPRLRVASGSVAIGGAQTGIYPAALPGGWHLIGRTPWRLFDPQRSPPNRLAPGDAVRFVMIDVVEYQRSNEHAE